MDEQQQLPLVSQRQFQPSQRAVEGAARYSKGRHNPEGLADVQADRMRGFGMQKAYRDEQESPGEQPGIRKSYEAMRGEVHKQYAYMTKPESEGGMGITHEAVNHDPYWDSDFKDTQGTVKRMIADVDAGRIQTHKTSPEEGHALFSPEENDKFRAVHDVFGHAAIGRGFSRHGEEAAYLSHRQMFPREAQAAMASETRGQNSVLNYSPQGGFPDQSSKLVGLPKFAQQTKRRR